MSTEAIESTTIEPGEQAANLLPRPIKYIESVKIEGERFAQAADAGALDSPIAACPGWNMRDLVRHLGEIHLWAAANVAYPRPHWLNVAHLTDLARYWPELASEPPPDDQIVSWYRATHENLVAALETAPVDVDAFTFLPAPTPLAMWARRQASEIAIHRFDAAQARGIASSYDPEFASDMLDELLSGFAPLSRGTETECVLHVDATDVDEHWWLTIGPRGVTTSRQERQADLTVAGTATDLYLSLWNRKPDGHLQLTGDVSVLELWRATCRVEWSR